MPFSETDWAAIGVALTSEGKIVLAGRTTTGIFVRRFDASGNTDTSFGKSSSGQALLDVGNDEDVTDMEIDASGRIVLSGSIDNSSALRDTFIARLTAAGEPDTQLNGAGYQVIPVSAGADYGSGGLAIDSEGRILVGGRAFFGALAEGFVLRALPNGNRDTTFGSDGVVRVTANGEATVAEDIAVQSTGRILLGGFSSITDDGSFVFHSVLFGIWP